MVPKVIPDRVEIYPVGRNILDAPDTDLIQLSCFAGHQKLVNR